MAFSTLLACLRVDRSNADLLAVVGDVAARFGSAVIGVAARQASIHAYIKGAGPGEPPEHDLHKFKERCSAAEQEFRAALSKVETLEWRTQMTFGPAYEHVANEARAADLVIAPLDRHERFFFPSGQAEIGDLVMRLGRPILAAHDGATGLEFGQALVCFKDAREARRAVADALPILQAMQRVSVVEIVEARAVDEARRRLADVGDWLARHGVESTCSAEVAQGTEAEQLAAVARDLNADLIVAGAFGHSRLREWAFGGVTRDLILRGERCVLASH